MSEIQGKPVYGICECKEQVQVLSVDQVVDLIQQMAVNDWQVPADYIPKTSVNGIVEQKSGDEIKLWIGKQAEYDALTDEEKAHKFAIITDDPALNEISTQIQNLKDAIDNLSGRLDKLGFKTGSITLTSDATCSSSLLCRQGNYVYGNIRGLFTLSYGLIGMIPEGFRPKEYTEAGVVGTVAAYGYVTNGTAATSLKVTESFSASIDTNGQVCVFQGSNSDYKNNLTVTATASVTDVYFGYEAEPLEE